MSSRSIWLCLPLATISCIGLQDFGDRSTDAAVTDAAVGVDAVSPSDASTGDAIEIPAPGTITVLWGGSDRSSGSSSTVRLSRGFLVDRTEVTVGAFRGWVDAGMPAPCPGARCTLDPGGPYEKTMKWEPADDPYVAVPKFKTHATCEWVFFKDPATWESGNDALPINCVTYAQAAAYCHFRGKRLLTEIEWYWVASGRGQARTYPTGDVAPSTCSDALFGIDGIKENPCGFPKPVGATASDRSRDGVLDMTGSLREWVYAIPPGPFLQPATLPDDWVGAPRTMPGEISGKGEELLVRGGTYHFRAAYTKSTYASRAPFHMGSTDLGFRCAKSL